jgi:predicted O-methyltransferase YrrM
MLTASNGSGHGTHSPFVFNFIKEVLKDDRAFYAYTPIEAQRQALLKDERLLTIEDFGAGSRVMKQKQRTVASIAASSLKPKKFSQLLFRMIDHYQPKTIVEIGSSLGITTSYLAAAKTDAQVFTMEGASSVATIAKESFNHLQLNNIELIEGNFDNTLLPLLERIASVDFAFVDGNHRYEPTMRYFNQLLAHCQDKSILILDDIHWSKEMDQAWDEVKAHPAVTLTIDLFFIGIVLISKDFKTPQHFAIRF